MLEMVSGQLADHAYLVWSVWGLVSAILIVAAVIDGRQLKVPNWITFPMIISGWVARNVYHVVYDPVNLKVDEEETAKKRENVLRTRRERGIGYKDFMVSWSRKRPPESSLNYYGIWPER